MRVHHNLRVMLWNVKALAYIIGIVVGSYVVMVVESTMIPMERVLTERMPELSRGFTVMMIALVIVGGITLFENRIKK